MRNRTSILLHLLFFIIVAVELTGRVTGNISFEYPVKPLLMIWIAVYFLRFRKKREMTTPVLLAFFFSWVGDIFLMFSHLGEYFFFAGVGGFFLAQLSYMYVFATYSENGARGYLERNLVIVFLFLGYAAGIIYLLYPGLEGLMKPVIMIYALSLIGMSMLALNRKGRVNRTSFLLVFTGSVLFVLSDSMIAISRFSREFLLSGLWIMLTYIAAQYLIMRGLILEK